MEICEGSPSGQGRKRRVAVGRRQLPPELPPLRACAQRQSAPRARAARAHGCTRLARAARAASVGHRPRARLPATGSKRELA
jgi:hypothetical protein